MANSPPKADRFTTLPILVAVALSGAVIAFGYTALNFEQFAGLWILSSVFSIAAFLGGLMLLGVRLMRARWRSAFSIGFALALLLGCFLARFELYFQIDRMRFQVFKDHYVGLLNPSSGQPTALRWGLWVYFLTGPIYRMLIHDPSDDIRSEKIRALLETKIENFSFCELSTRRLDGHFYSVVAAC
jgi:hypothetical protein